jgi:outer membrane receptor protein involved in Fe transport
MDLGTIIKPANRLVLNTTLWTLFLDQEFVYVGDAGIVEPSGKTRRMGLEVGARYQPLDWLYLYTDANYTHARSTEEADGEDYIPLAPDFTMTGGVTLGGDQGLSGGLNYRYIDDRPANEDNSIVAEGYFVTDAALNYSVNNWTFGLILETCSTRNGMKPNLPQKAVCSTNRIRLRKFILPQEHLFIYEERLQLPFSGFWLCLLVWQEV